MAKKQTARPPRITGIIRQDKQVYRAGDEEALAKVLTPELTARYREVGVIAGDWGAPSAEKDAAAEAEAKTARKNRA